MTSHRLLRESNIPVVLSPGKGCLQASVRMLFPDPLRDCHRYPHFIDEETKGIVNSRFLISLKAETEGVIGSPVPGRVPGEGKLPVSP